MLARSIVSIANVNSTQTLKKRDADGEDVPSSKKPKKSTKEPTHISPIRYKLPLPKPADFATPMPPTFTLVNDRAYESSEQSVWMQCRSSCKA